MTQLTERQRIEKIVRANGWTIDVAQIIVHYLRDDVAIKVEYSGPRSDYQQFAVASRRDDNGSVTTIDTDTLVRWFGGKK